MKNVIKLLMSFVLILSMATSCSESNNTIDEVLNFQTGAILRTISVNSNTLNSGDPNTNFSVTIEEQDAEDGGLFKAVNVYATLRDLSPDNGTNAEGEFTDVLIKTIDASEFTTGSVGLPRGTISVTYGETASVMGLNSTNAFGGDVVVYVLKLELTDGRVFDDLTAGSSVTGGFFNAPHKYNALLLCAPEPGDYRVDMHDSYGDGWQTNAGNGGDGIHVTIDGSITVVGMCSPYGSDNIGSEMDESLGFCTGPASTSFYDASTTVNIPNGSLEATWDFPGDNYGEISFEVFDPNSNMIFDSGGSGNTSAGLLPIIVCASN